MSLETALAALRNAKRVDGTRASYRKDNPQEWASVMDYLDGGARPSGALTLMGQGFVDVEDVRRGSAPPPPPPPPPPPTGTPISHLSDIPAAFEPEWNKPTKSKQQLSEINTPRGPGFKFVAGPNDHPTWDANTKAILARMDTDSAMRTENYHFEFMFPTGGNADGFFSGWHAGLVWEYHTQSDSGHHLAIDGSQKRLHFGLWKPPFTPGAAGYQHFYLPGTVQMDHWYVCDLEIKWATDPSGHLRFTADGQQVVDYSGQTIKAGETRWLQFGFYSRNHPSNEVQFAGVSKS